MKKSMAKIHASRKRKMLRRCKPRRRDQGRPQLSAKGLRFDFSEKSAAIACGGVPLLHQLCERLGLKEEIDRGVRVLKQHQPYRESDHVLNIAFNILAGGTRVEHIEHLRRDTAYLDALGAHSLPDPTTAGDFCRRFQTREEIDALQEAFNRVRAKVWQQQDEDFFDRAVVEGDGTLCGTNGECREGMDIAYNGTWGYHPLVLSLANTAEPLYLLNRPGNRPSHEGAGDYFDRAKDLCLGAGFRKIHFRGDTDFTQTRHLDGWDDAGVTFTFGIDARQNLIALAGALQPAGWAELPPRARYEVKTTERTRPVNVKKEVIERRGFRHLRTEREEVAEIAYRPTKCRKAYRLVMLKKTVEVTQGLFAHLEWETRYFFYLSNRTDLTAAEVVHDARQRCDQENLNAHLKRGVHALTMPLGDLHANWAYAVMASLAWSVKAWAALLLPASGRWQEKHGEEKHRLLRMEFHTFRQALVNLPAQIVKTGRRLLVRLLNWSEWTPAFFRLARMLAYPLRC